MFRVMELTWKTGLSENVRIFDNCTRFPPTQDIRNGVAFQRFIGWNRQGACMKVMAGVDMTTWLCNCLHVLLYHHSIVCLHVHR